MPRHLSLTVLLTSFCCCYAADVNLDSVTALAKSYFRDSAEVPMSVAVTTVVTDTAGKVKHRGQSTVRMVFHGYNRASGKWSFRGDSGWFNTGYLRDSVSGEMAAFYAAGFLAEPKNSTHDLEIQQSTEPGKPALVVMKEGECPKLEMMPRWLFPKRPCGSWQFSVTSGPGNELTFQHFSFDGFGLPVAAKTAAFGNVQILAFHTGVDFQKTFQPGDKMPFLWPKQTVTEVSTNKGKVTITNQYSPKK